MWGIKPTMLPLIVNDIDLENQSLASLSIHGGSQFLPHHQASFIESPMSLYFTRGLPEGLKGLSEITCYYRQNHRAFCDQ